MIEEPTWCSQCDDEAAVKDGMCLDCYRRYNERHPDLGPYGSPSYGQKENP